MKKTLSILLFIFTVYTQYAMAKQDSTFANIHITQKLGIGIMPYRYFNMPKSEFTFNNKLVIYPAFYHKILFLNKRGNGFVFTQAWLYSVQTFDFMVNRFVAGQGIVQYTYKGRQSTFSVSILCSYKLTLYNKQLYSFYSTLGTGLRGNKRWLKSDYGFNSYLIKRINEDYYVGKRTIYDWPFALEALLGFQYKFSKTLGGYIEVGIAKTFLQAGIYLR
jgi:hypothetical protein